MNLRDYQQEAVDFLVPRKRAFVQAPAGSGKTIIGAFALARASAPGQRALWLGNTLEQVQQGIAAIQSCPGPQGVGFEVCCVASQPDVSGFDFIVFDECHHMPAETWTALLQRTRPDAVVWGLSATPWHPDPERNAVVRAAFPEMFEVARSRVEASGHIERGKVFFHDVDLPGQFDGQIEREMAIMLIQRCRNFPRIPRFEHERRIRWQLTQQVLQSNENRNLKVIQLGREAQAKGSSTLLLVHSVEHGERIASNIVGSVLVHSKVGAGARRLAIQGFREGTVRVLIATSLADEGLDVPRAETLILASGGRSAAKIEQRAGRVLRPFPGKSGGVIHDFLDLGAGMAQAQSRARWAVYQKLGYEPEVVLPESKKVSEG